MRGGLTGVSVLVASHVRREQALVIYTVANTEHKTTQSLDDTKLDLHILRQDAKGYARCTKTHRGSGVDVKQAECENSCRQAAL